MRNAILLFLLCSFSAHAQYPSLYWAKTFGSDGYANGKYMAVDQAGNLYVTGVFAGDCDFDPGIGKFKIYSNDGGKDIFISKFDANGQFIWAKTVGGKYDESVSGIGTDALGNVYITGQLSYVGDYDPGPATLTLGSIGDQDIFFMKLDPNGNLVWANKIGGGFEDVVKSMVVDASGNMYTTGSYRSSVDFDPGPGMSILSSAGNTDIYVLKIDSAGMFKWVKRMGANTLQVDGGNAIALDHSGNIIIGGFFAGTADFNPNGGVFTLSSVGYSDLFVLKLTVNGNFVWAKSLGGNKVSSFTNVQSLCVDANDNIFVMGIFSDTVDFDPGVNVANLSAVSSNDTYIMKMNASGEYVWAKSFVSDQYMYANSLAQDGFGNLLITGSFLGTVDFDPGAADFSLVSLSSYDEIFLCELDSSGNFKWADKMGASMWDAGNAIITDGMNNVYTTGYYFDSMDAAPGTSSNYIFSGVGTDAYILKMNAFPLHTKSHQHEVDIQVYPNPTNGLTRFVVHPDVENATIILYNSNGSILLKQTGFNGNEFPIDMTNFTSGVYILQLSAIHFTKTITLSKP